VDASSSYSYEDAATVAFPLQTVTQRPSRRQIVVSATAEEGVQSRRAALALAAAALLSVGVVESAHANQAATKNGSCELTRTWASLGPARRVLP
jgi:hypothetical protein